ncbi:hypothetical protein EYF80_067913 [Liparis tanakae]|uniref:Uncharacterized protein n=1 Tax=Liparis tanakae TaxID=230148 RepID=A0A4Z2DZM9_9TELE|nr:hypothetical protein EYF80_067913 [Liparis tanakae]
MRNVPEKDGKTSAGRRRAHNAPQVRGHDLSSGPQGAGSEVHLISMSSPPGGHLEVRGHDLSSGPQGAGSEVHLISMSSPPGGHLEVTWRRGQRCRGQRSRTGTKERASQHHADGT